MTDRSNRIREAQAVVRVARDTVKNYTKNGALIHYLPGVINENAGSYSASVYIAASEYLSEDVIVYAGQYMNSGDYVMVATMGSKSWISDVLPYSIYSKLVADWNTGRVGIGTGLLPSFNFGAYGNVFYSGGPDASAYWGPSVGGGGGGGALTDHTHATTGSGATGGGSTLAPATVDATGYLSAGTDLYAGDDVFLSDGLRWYPPAGDPDADYDVEISRTGVSTLGVDDGAGGDATVNLTGDLNVNGLSVTGRKVIVIRASGADDAATIRSEIAAADEGTTFYFPDPLYLLQTVDSEKVAINITKDNIQLRGLGRGNQNSDSPTGFGATSFKFDYVASSAYTMVQWRAAGDPQAGTLTQPVIGGGLHDIFLDGNAMSGYGLSVKAAQSLHFSDFQITKNTITSLLVSILSHTSGGPNTLNVVKGTRFDRFSLYHVGTGPSLDILGNPTYGAEDPYACVFRDGSINYNDAQGIRIKGADDIWLYNISCISGSSATDAYSLEITNGGNSFTGGIHVYNPMLLQSPKGVIVRSAGLYPPQQVMFHGVGTVDRTTPWIVVEPGADVHYFTDDGLTTMRNDIAHATPPLVDDFMRGDNTSTHIGELGWFMSAATVTNTSAVANHPGIKKISTGASAATLAYLMLGTNSSILPSMGFKEQFILRLNHASSDTDVMCRFGLSSDATSDTANHGIYIEKVYADSSWYAVCRSGGTQTRTAIVSVGSADTWIRAMIYRYNDTKIGFHIGDMTNGSPDVKIDTNVPTSTLTPFMQVKNQSGTKTFEIDAFQLQVVGLTR